MERVRDRLSAIALASSLVTCGIASPSGPQDSLRGVVWELQSFDTRDDGIIAVPAPERYTVLFSDDGGVQVGADCNVCSGPYRAEGSSLTLGPPLACTEVYCGEESLHDRYLEALVGVSSYELDGSRLQMTYQAGLMSFSARR